jgi:predicted ArsR family transcriptional regulator
VTNPVRKVNALAQAKMIALLLEGPQSNADIGEVTGLHRVTISEYMRALVKEGAAHISSWLPDSMGRDATPVYALGKGRNARRRKLSCAERAQRNRDRRKQAQQALVVAGKGRFVQSANGGVRFEMLA